MKVLLTGGSACGKSTYAESLAVRLGGRLWYIAAMRPFGEESQMRIERHRRMRAEKGFETIERYTDINGITLPARGTVLWMPLQPLRQRDFRPEGAGESPWTPYLRHRPSRAAVRAPHRCQNDVGADGGGYGELTMRYVDALGELNARWLRALTACWSLCAAFRSH
jgi:adenosylcobinamide kinase/adenosylcobinamide-phosphate guanylyltransferase